MSDLKDYAKGREYKMLQAIAKSVSWTGDGTLASTVEDHVKNSRRMSKHYGELHDLVLAYLMSGLSKDDFTASALALFEKHNAR
jgi:hypothetical protein